MRFAFVLALLSSAAAPARGESPAPPPTAGRSSSRARPSSSRRGATAPAKTIRVRATIQRFDRDAYRIGPKYTDGWLARVQTLAKVVAEEGTVELTLFARPAAAAR